MAELDAGLFSARSMGVVYEADDRARGHRVAIKTVRAARPRRAAWRCSRWRARP